MKRALFLLTLLCTSSLAATSARAVGPANPYWVTDGDNHKVYKVQGGAIVQTIVTGANPDHEYSIAVTNSEIRTFAANPGWYGREYSVAGVPTGPTYTNNGTYTGTFDGTTDGVNYNYSVPVANGNVVRYDRNWANPQSIFFDPVIVNQSWAGITYDPSDGTLWLNRKNSSTADFRHYSLTGTLLGSFSLGVPSNWGLAYDRTTDSLWFLGAFNSQLAAQTIYNVTKTGTLLETVNIPGLIGNPAGGEMAIPEPTSLGFLLGAALSLRGRVRTPHRHPV